MKKERKIFTEYRRQLLPDTEANAFEGNTRGLDALMNQLRKNRMFNSPGDSIWEICLVDWSRMFKVVLN